MAYPVHADLGNVDARDSFSDLGQSFTSRTADDWADCANRLPENRRETCQEAASVAGWQLWTWQKKFTKVVPSIFCQEPIATQ